MINALKVNDMQAWKNNKANKEKAEAELKELKAKYEPAKQAKELAEKRVQYWTDRRKGEKDLKDASDAFEKRKNDLKG